MNNQKIIKTSITTVFTILLLSFSSVNVEAQFTTNKLADDHYEIVLDKSITDSIRILQVTDLHLGHSERWRDDLNTFNRIKKLVELYNPDLIFVTGDLFTTSKPIGNLLSIFSVNFFDGFERPWFYVFGNHDAAGDYGKDAVYNVFKSSEWGILGYHGSGELKKYDYYIDIKVDNVSTPIWQVYGIDTGPHDGIKATQPDQIDWYKNISKQTKEKYNINIRAISIFHIPVIQYQELWNDESIEKSGVSEEKVFYEEDDGTLYDAFVEMGNVEATFCGHDHYNNYWGKYIGGIILAYGYISGESTNEAWPTGGKLITLPIAKGEIGIKNVVPIFEEDEHQY